MPVVFAVSPLDYIKKIVYENVLLSARFGPRKSKIFAWSGPYYIWSHLMLSFIKGKDIWIIEADLQHALLLLLLVLLVTAIFLCQHS